MGTILDPQKMMFMADRDTWNKAPKTINGRKVKLVATRVPRNPLKYRKVYVYLIEGTTTIVFNRSGQGVYFMKMGMTAQQIRRYYNIFANPPITKEEREWLDRNDYTLL